jgi:hypothetical protein
MFDPVAALNNDDIDGVVENIDIYQNFEKLKGVKKVSMRCLEVLLKYKCPFLGGYQFQSSLDYHQKAFLLKGGIYPDMEYLRAGAFGIGEPICMEKLKEMGRPLSGYWLSLCHNKATFDRIVDEFPFTTTSRLEYLMWKGPYSKEVYSRLGELNDYDKIYFQKALECNEWRYGTYYHTDDKKYVAAHLESDGPPCRSHQLREET